MEMDVEEVIQKMARAIHDADEYHNFNGATTDEVKQSWEDARRFPVYEDKVLKKAKAALSALREDYAIVPRTDLEVIESALTEKADREYNLAATGPFPIDTLLTEIMDNKTPEQDEQSIAPPGYHELQDCLFHRRLAGQLKSMIEATKK